MHKEIWAFICAISRHWEPLVTGLAALAVSVVVGVWWGDHAPWWVWVSIVITSVLIASFLAWRETKREKDDAKKYLDFLNTPSVTITLGTIDDDVFDPVQTLFLEITGVGVAHVRPEVFAMSVEGIGEGKRVILCNSQIHWMST